MDHRRKPDDITTLLHAWRAGDGAAFSEAIDQVYAELKNISRRQLAKFGGAASLSPTELLHEALIGILPGEMEFNSRAHFLATMSLAIRSMLIDHARAQNAQKRGGGLLRVTLTDGQSGEDALAADLLALDQALNQLEALDPRSAQVMHLAFFGGLSREEIALLLKISPATVRRDLRFARAWLERALSP